MDAQVWALAALCVLNPHGSFEHRAVAPAGDDHMTQAVRERSHFAALPASPGRLLPR